MGGFQYYVGQVRGVGAELKGLPRWAHFIVSLAAVPGVVLLLLSIFAFAVSLLALLLLAGPVYVILKRLTGGGSPDSAQREQGEPSPGVKRVEATIVE